MLPSIKVKVITTVILFMSFSSALSLHLKKKIFNSHTLQSLHEYVVSKIFIVRTLINLLQVGLLPLFFFNIFLNEILCTYAVK